MSVPYHDVPAAPPSFHGTDAARERREMRRAISKINKLSHSEKFVLQSLVNVWFAHRHKSAVIHPGRVAIAKTAKVSVRTVATILKAFRDLGFIQPIEYAKGGRKATRYVVHLEAIRDAAYPPVKVVPGDLVSVPTERANLPASVPKPCKSCTRSLKKAKTSLSRDKGSKTAEIIRPSRFSIWRGTARVSFLGWVSGQQGIDPYQRRVLEAIGHNLCPDDGFTAVSTRTLAKKTGFSRRVAGRVLAELIADEFISVMYESRSRRRLYAGIRMAELLEAAPGMPF